MAKKPPKKKPAKKKPVAKKKPDALRPPHKGVKVDFSKQRFCPACGKLFDIDIIICTQCDSNLAKINPIGEKDQKLRALALTALKHSNTKTRKKAIDDLGDYEELQILGVLTHVLLNDPDETVRKEAADELGNLHHPFSLETLSKALKDESPLVRKEAIEGLKKIKKKTEAKEVTEVKAEKWEDDNSYKAEDSDTDLV